MRRYGGGNAGKIASLILEFAKSGLLNAEGSWASQNGRWWEKDSILDTADAITTLEIIDNKL